MLVALKNRALIERVSPALANELADAFAVISQTFTREHDAQGAHLSAFSIPVDLQTQLDALSAAIAAIAETPWVTIQKSTDESRSDDGGSGAGVVVEDGELKFSMAANTRYVIRVVVFYELDEVSTGNVLKHRWTGPSGAAVVQGDQRVAGSAYDSRQFDAYDSSNQDAAAYTSTATNDRGILTLNLLVDNGSTAGTFALKWVSGKATAASATVRKGSYLEYLQQ